MRFFARLGVALVASLTLGAAYAAEYTRDAGTAVWMCCVDQACTEIINQRASEVAAFKDCEALTDADHITRYVRSNPFRVTSAAPPPPPPDQCPPKPADETQVAQCPTGFTGSWTQTQSYGSVPYPTCWVPSGFIPSQPPEGACTAIPPPPPPPIAAVGGISASSVVNQDRYDVRLSWLAATNATRYEIQRCTGATCTNFAPLAGAPPSPLITGFSYTNNYIPGGLTYRYIIRGMNDATGAIGAWSVPRNYTTPAPPPPPTGTGTATIEWTPPTENTDGSPLVDLSGFRIVYGTSPTALSQSIQLPNPGLTTYTVEDLATGTWYFVVRAFNSAGTESANSGVGQKTIQ
jgi:hypothetical protein